MEEKAKRVQKLPKVIAKQYTIKVNNEPIFTSETLREAKAYIAQMILNEAIKDVTVVKEAFTETVLTTFHPQITRVLIADDLSNDFFNEAEEA